MIPANFVAQIVRPEAQSDFDSLEPRTEGKLTTQQSRWILEPWRLRQFMKSDKETRKTGGKKVGVGTRSLDRANHWSGDSRCTGGWGRVFSNQLKAAGRQHGLLLNFAKTTLEPKRVIAS